MSEDSSRPRPRSVVERLSTTVGVSVDPDVVLPGDSEPGRESLGALGRMRSRRTHSGRYRLEGEIARGGMGAILEVWDEDLKRKLAMKVALGKGGGNRAASSAEELDPRVLSRFLEEAQVTGQLEHPGIVPVYELGIDDEGGVYFTMQLVRGRDLSEVFRLVPSGEDGWSVTRALGVLMKVCEAMAFAHSKGVVHRDLKPANIMVGQFGEVYVMDWGLVRVRGRAEEPGVLAVDRERVETDGREGASGDSSDALHTRDGDVLGTPAYMSPEQARGSIEQLDERSDVYSVGAMLYHLLAGAVPFDRRGEPSLGAHETLSALYAGPPPPLGALAPDAPAELVAIAEKAMAREPKDRYSDMLGLAKDLRAYLENRVVQAYQTGAVAEARKWVRRNRSLAASMAAGLLALLAGLVISLALKSQSDANAERASRQGALAREVADFMNKDVFGAIAPGREDFDVSVREVLQIASARLGGRFEDKPLVEAELRLTLGTSFERIGDFESAREHLARSHELWVAGRGERSEPALATALSLSAVESSLGSFDKALERLEQTLVLLESEFGPNDAMTLNARVEIASTAGSSGDLSRSTELFAELEGDLREHLGNKHELTMRGLTMYADMLLARGSVDEAETLQAEALEGLRETLGAGDPETLGAAEVLGEIYMTQGRPEEAEKLLLDVQRTREAVLGPDHPATANGMGLLGIHYFQQGRTADAEVQFSAGLESLCRYLGSEHPFALQMSNNLAAAWSRLGRGEEALELRTETLAASRRTLGDEHPQTILSISNLAALLKSLGRFDESETASREAIELIEHVYGTEHRDYWTALENLSGLMLAQGRHAESLELTQSVLEGRQSALGEMHPAVARTCFNLGVASETVGERESARGWYEEAIRVGQFSDAWDIVTQSRSNLASLSQGEGDLAGAQREYLAAVDARLDFGIEDLSCGEWLLEAGTCAFQLNDFPGAARNCTRALEVFGNVAPRDDESAIRTMVVLVRSLLRSQRFEDAESLGIELHDILVVKDGEGSQRVGQARSLLRQVYDAWGRPEEASSWR